MRRPERWRATPKSIFSVATAESRDLHLTILSLFADRDLTDPALTLEDVLRALPEQAPDLDRDEAAVRRSLEQLTEWGLLDESRNESATYRDPGGIPAAKPPVGAHRSRTDLDRSTRCRRLVPRVGGKLAASRDRCARPIDRQGGGPGR